MSIPLNQLYHYIEDIAQEIFGNDVIIYRFFPDGSKKIEDLTYLGKKSFKDHCLQPEIFCNDQEPLNYLFYQNKPNRLVGQINATSDAILNQNGYNFPSFNFRGQIRNVWDHCLLIHSEQRSSQVSLYQQTQFITVYYWCHAVIARDWFRYTEHINQHKQVNKIFLIYSRAWSGTREYRLRFAELLIQVDLLDHCRTTINPIEPELDIHYKMHQFENTAWQPQTVLENYFPTSDAHSSYSASVDIEDYEATDIEVVLETLFDDGRLHLTEKSLRPIACGQPFILAGTHGSLEYLRTYGFKTFGDIWDETYDTIENPEERMHAITDLMKQIANWSADLREHMMARARIVAEYNKQHFFSKEFSKQIESELKINLSQAFEQMTSNNTGKFYLERRQIYRSIPELKSHLTIFRTDEEANQIFELAKKYIK